MPAVYTLGVSALCAVVLLVSGRAASDHSYANLLNLLRSATNGTRGPNIRIGGDSADETWFSVLPNGPNGPNDSNKVTVQDIATYAYVAQWNGTVIVDLNINQEHNTTNSIEYAVAAMDLLDPAIISGFEVGNEPDLFGFHNIRPLNWSYDEYNRLFQRYADALQTQGKMQMPRIQGATFGCCWTFYLNNYTEEWTTPGPVGSPTQNLLSSVSQHHYPMPSTGATIEALMSSWAADGVYLFALNANVAQEKGIPFVIGEGNSCFNGGALGVSNTFASALWAIDTMSWASVGNISRWNFHGCPGGPYTPIAINYTSNSAVARPLFYGMWFFSRLTANEARFVKAILRHNEGVANLPNVVAWATLDKFKKLRVALLQKTVQNATAETVQVHLGDQYGNIQGLSYQLSATSQNLAEEHDIEFAGQTLNRVAGGIPKGTSVPSRVVANEFGCVDVVVQQASALSRVLRSSRRCVAPTFSYWPWPSTPFTIFEPHLCFR